MLDENDKVVYDNSIVAGFLCGYGGTGRRNGLKIRWGQPRAGSIPAFRTN